MLRVINHGRVTDGRIRACALERRQSRQQTILPSRTAVIRNSVPNVRASAARDACDLKARDDGRTEREAARLNFSRVLAGEVSKRIRAQLHERDRGRGVGRERIIGSGIRM